MVNAKEPASFTDNSEQGLINFTTADTIHLSVQNINKGGSHGIKSKGSTPALTPKYCWLHIRISVYLYSKSVRSILCKMGLKFLCHSWQAKWNIHTEHSSSFSRLMVKAGQSHPCFVHKFFSWITIHFSILKMKFSSFLCFSAITEAKAEVSIIHLDAILPFLYKNIAVKMVPLLLALGWASAKPFLSG